MLGGKEETQDVSHHRRRTGAAPGRPTHTRRTPRLTDVHARNVRAPASSGATYGHQSGPFPLLRCRQGAGVRGSCRVGHECAIRQGKHTLRHHQAWLGHAAQIRVEHGRPVSLNWSDDEVPLVAGALGKRKRIHVATYSSRGVSLHTGRPGEPTIAVPIPPVPIPPVPIPPVPIPPVPIPP